MLPLFKPKPPLLRTAQPRRSSVSRLWDQLLDAVFKRYAGHIVMIDSSCVRVPQHGANAQKGALPILARVVPVAACPQKIQPLVDADGRPGWLSSTEGHTADAAMVESSLSGLQPGATLLADMACNTQPIRHFPRQRKYYANIRAKAYRLQAVSFSRWLYRQRNRIERFFNRMKQTRGLASRHVRRAGN